MHDFEKFSRSSNALNLLFSTSSHASDKSGLWYDLQSRKYHNQAFAKRKRNSCSHCGKVGDASVKCRQQRRSPKVNGKGPKRIWVPKSLIILVADMLYKKRLGSQLVSGQWMLASHDNQRSTFLNLIRHDEGKVAFGGISKGKIFIIIEQEIRS